MYVGGKTSRGFGKLACEQVYRKCFESSKTGLTDWMQFKWEDLKKLEPEETEFIPLNDIVEAELMLNGSVLIRDDYSIIGEEDHAHITSDGIPVIYGTSWAGAIRGGLARFLKTHGQPNCEQYLDKVFGFNDEAAKKTTPSCIRIDASYFDDDTSRGESFCVTRVKIDRWTGGVSKGALFTVRPQFGGKVTLRIHIPKDSQAIQDLFMLALQAIDLGIITIGGETSVGRGVFDVASISINGKPQDKAALFKTPKKELKECLKCLS
jgi:CRISPR/Cas system CSM-associated protein Csm3 (group 7 of RAMP superfamily)